MSQCKIPGCEERAKGLGLCQHHYDQIYSKIRRERDKLRKKECPFLRFENPYREKSGFHIIFNVIRNSRPLTKEQIFRQAKMELVQAGMSAYRIDYAWEILKAKKHTYKRGNYQLKQDGKGCWHLIRDVSGRDRNDPTVT